MAEGAPKTVGLVVTKNLRRMGSQRVLCIPEQRVFHGEMTGLAKISNLCIGQEGLLDAYPPGVVGLLKQAGPLIQGRLVLVLVCFPDVPVETLFEHALIVSLENLPFLFSFGTEHPEGSEETHNHESDKGYS
jgi:hypothetical protein